MTCPKRLVALVGAAILLAGAAGYAVSQTVSVPTEARVIVQKHPSGAVEVALEQGGERYLPQARFVSRDAETGRWLRSSAVTIEVDVPEPEAEVIEKIVEVEVEKIVEVEVEKIVEVEVEKIVEVEVEKIVEVEVEKIVEVEVEKIVEVEVERIVEVEVEKIVEVEPPVVRLAVRPSDHEDAGLSCLEAEDEEGNTWTWTDEEEVSTGASTAFGVYSAGAWSGWATALVVELEDFRVEDWQDLQQSAAWHAQCAQYHGVDILLTDGYATEPDDWSKVAE